MFPQPVMSAHDGVCIRADGSIDGTSSIQRDGDVYTFTDNLYDVILLVENDNVVIDGAGYILYGDGQIHGPTEAGGMGVELVECNNVTIKNLTIKKFTRGIRLTNSFDCNVYQNTLTNNSIGIELGGVDKSYIDSYASNNTVSGNVIKENNTGIRLNLGSSNTVCENTITKNNYGICILGASENSIIYNHITNNQKGVYFEISGINIFHHNNFDNNINDCWDYGLTPWCFQLPFSVNIWDDGKEGNYWNNYNGTDNNGDDIGDEPYVIDEKNQDNYPLLTPVTIETIPEFSSLTLLFVLLVAVVAVTVNYKRKLQQRSRHK
ncbi:MAG: right-handed parallel beta-helix repeat-containing protein [archaeon]